jgi:hypothetical protein
VWWHPYYQLARLASAIDSSPLPFTLKDLDSRGGVLFNTPVSFAGQSMSDLDKYGHPPYSFKSLAKDNTEPLRNYGHANPSRKQQFESYVIKRGSC